MRRSPRDRWRGKAIKSKIIGVGRTMAIMAAGGYQETHTDNKIWTHVQGKGDRETKSRIDRIYFRSNQPSEVVNTEVRVPDIMTSDHRLVIATLITERKHEGGKQKKGKQEKTERYPRVANQPVPVLEKFANKITELVKHNQDEWKRKLDNPNNIGETDRLITYITERFKEVGMKFLAKGKKGGKSNLERKWRKRLEDCNKVRARIREIRNKGTSITPGHAKNLAKKIAAILKKPVEISDEKLEGIQESLNEAYKKIRNKWRATRKPTREDRNKRLWEGNPHGLMSELLKETEKGDPHAVIDPEDGCLCTEGNRVKEIFRDALQGKMGKEHDPFTNEPDWQQHWVEENEHLEDSYDIEKPFTKQEVRKVLMDGTDSKAGGEDGVNIGLLRAAVRHAPEDDETVLEMITKITQAIFDAEGRLQIHKNGIGKILWKEAGSRHTSNIRPITLHNAIGKIPSKIIADRLTSELCSRSLLHDANEGFMIEKGCENAIFTLLNAFEDAKSNKKALYTCLYDLSGAYDSLPHETIKRGMDILHLPQKTQRYILNKLKGNSLAVKTAHGITESFMLKKGVAQGCPLSPIVFIIAMNPLHMGLEKNPICDGARDGYKMENKMTGEEIQIASKGYADDTGTISSSQAGMKRMAEWVNEFCVVNRLSMNHKKTMLFGRSEEGKEMEETISIIRQGNDPPEKEDTKFQIRTKDDTTYTEIEIRPMSSMAPEIKYLGIYMNMDLNWDTQVAKLNSLVGRHMHIAISNNLTPEMTTFLFNHYLKPKLEYRMKFIELSQKQLDTYDKWINKTVADKIEEKLRAKTEAMQLILGVQWPSEYYEITQIAALEKAVNDGTHMGRTSRARLVDHEAGPNRVRRQRKMGNKSGLHLQKKPNYEKKLPTELKAGTRTVRIETGGEYWELPCDHTGTWGADLPKRKVTVFTDGSKLDDGNGDGPWQ
jgi:hypothetical protein